MILSFPGFELPDDAVIASLQQAVPEVSDLTIYGSRLSKVQETLRWLGSLPQVSVGTTFAMTQLQTL